MEKSQPPPINAIPRDLYRASEVQQLDRIAIEQYGIEGFTLMQRAGLVCFRALLERWPDVRRLLVFAGAGNNGGDACVVAGLAQEQGLDVQLVALANPQKATGDANLAWQWAEAKGVTPTSFTEFNKQTPAQPPNTVIVDGLFGTGLSRDATGDYATIIALINASAAPVLAIDIPSGLNADTGMPMACAVHADLTVTFIGMKQGLLTGQAGDHTGSLLFSDLQIPQRTYQAADAPEPKVSRIDILNATRQLQARRKASHKGDFGHVVVVGGDRGFGGAVCMASEAALRIGAGLVSVLTRAQHRAGILARRPELMVAGTGDKNFNAMALLAKASVIVVGPGLGTGEWSRLQLSRCLLAAHLHGIPLVIDADGLNLLAENGPKHLQTEIRDNCILTPHPGEAGRLLGTTTAAVSADRFAAIKSLQAKWGGHCLLKGYGSLMVCSEDPDRTYLCSEGNPGMATAGMGDILAGLIAGLVAQRLPLDRALRAAVCIHGEAADLAAESGQRGLLATNLLPHVRQLVNSEWSSQS